MLQVTRACKVWFVIFASICFSVLEQLQFFGDDPKNLTVKVGQLARLSCRVQTKDPITKIYWLKKIENQQLFRPNSIVFGSEQYEAIEQPTEQQYLNNILSKSLVFPQILINESGQYICLIQNDKATNYKTASINIIEGKNNRHGMISTC